MRTTKKKKTIINVWKGLFRSNTKISNYVHFHASLNFENERYLLVVIHLVVRQMLLLSQLSCRQNYQFVKRGRRRKESTQNIMFLQNKYGEKNKIWIYIFFRNILSSKKDTGRKKKLSVGKMIVMLDVRTALFIEQGRLRLL